MRVRVDEARNRRRSSGVVVLGDGNVASPLRPDIGDAAVANDDDRVFVNRKIAHRRAADAGAPGRCGDLCEIANEERATHVGDAST